VPRRPFTLPVRVYYEDTDTGGVVYYANYLKFFERARTEWLRAAGFGQQKMAEELGLQFVVVRVECDYRRPARLDDLLEIDMAVAQAGRASIVFKQAARRGSELIATARVRAACVDTREFLPRPLPVPMLDALQELDQPRPDMTPTADLSMISLISRPRWSCSW
jgi:acyl-CoA thioester hydrolase